MEGGYEWVVLDKRVASRPFFKLVERLVLGNHSLGLLLILAVSSNLLAPSLPYHIQVVSIILWA